jgi:CRISPR-associated protein Csm4
MSTEVEAIKLIFTGGLHVGRGAEYLDKTNTTYSSDALKSALFATGLAYYPTWGHDHKSFFEGFRISSAFPWHGNEFFLPKPAQMHFQFQQSDDLSEAKQAKKINYISADIFHQWVSSPEMSILVKDAQIADGSFLFSASGRKFLHSSVQQRVQVPTDGEGDTRTYYFERLLFENNSGLYFLISFLNADLKPQVLHVLNLLGEMGIGTDRTVGNGQFEVRAITDFPLISGTRGLQMALGLYLPSREEIDSMNLNESNWSLVKRGGYIAASDNNDYRSLRKNNIYFFGEGSTFNAAMALHGRYVDLQPQWNTAVMHPVWRCGMPLFINL